METVRHPLREIPLFGRLGDTAFRRVAELAVERRYRPGETVILEGDPCRAAYFIAQGQVRAARLSPAGREQVLTRLGKGESFNTVPPFQPQKRNHATVQALTDVTLYAIDAADFRHMIEEIPALATGLLEDFATRLDHLTNLVENLALYTVRARLAQFLLQHGNERTELANQAVERWTQDEIAAHLGTVRDVVGRTLRAFVDEGLIRIDRDEIVLLDRQALLAEANH